MAAPPYHARVLEGVKSFKSVAGYAWTFENNYLGGETTFGNHFEDSGVVVSSVYRTAAESALRAWFGDYSEFSGALESAI